MIGETEEKSREAENQAQKALAAMKEADIAKKNAEAGQQALLQAAADVEQVVDAVDRTGKNLETATGLVSQSGESLQQIVAESVGMADQIRSIATASEATGGLTNQIRELRELIQQLRAGK